MTSAPVPLRLANRPAEPARNVTAEPSEKRNGKSARASATRLGTGAAAGSAAEPTRTLKVGPRGIATNSATAAATATATAAALTASAGRRPRRRRRPGLVLAPPANDGAAA